MRIDGSTMSSSSSSSTTTNNNNGHNVCQTELVTKTTAQKNVIITPVRRRSSLSKRNSSDFRRRNSRTSRRNDRPVIECPMLDASECFSCPNIDVSLGDNNCKEEEDLEGSFSVDALVSAPEDNEDDVRKNGFNRITKDERDFQQHAKQQIENTKQFMARRLNRVDMKFFKENPSKKVPKFNRSELSLGSQLGEGEFGSVFSVESFNRRGSSSFIILDEHRESNNGIHTTLGEPRISGSLDDFIQKWHKILGGQENDPTTINTEPTESKAGNHESSISDKEDPTNFSKTEPERSSELMRISSHLKDCKDFMIHRQNSVESFDGYAVKLLRTDITNENVKSMAAFDMITEAKILSALSHPNIIQIRGIMGCVELGNYGIIMDKLSSTLEDQIHKWAKYTTEGKVRNKAPRKHRVLEHVPKWMLVRQHEKDKQETCLRQTEFFVERMEAVLDVSNAMGYLHEKRIIFRDLKPENVGLYNDSYVLFDFGLARELKESDRMGVGEDSYRATGLTGSRLFMSPEVAMKKPYGFSADVYSFAILFWEVVSLQEVFSNMTMSKHYNQVIVKGKRPSSMEDVLPHELDDMMVASWDKNPTNRPSFESISKTLVQELDKIRNKKFKTGSESMKSFISFSNNSGSSANSKEFGLNARWDDFGTPISRSGTEKRVKKMSMKLQLPLPHTYEKGSNRESKMDQTKIWDSLRKIKDKKANNKSGLSSTNHEKGRMSKVTALLESPKKIRTSKSHPIMFRSSVTRILYGGKDQVTRDDKA